MSLLLVTQNGHAASVKKRAAGKKEPLTVRLDPDDIAGLAEMHAGTGLDESTLVRESLRAAVRYYRKNSCISFPVRLIPEEIYKRVVQCADTYATKAVQVEQAYAKTKGSKLRPY